MFARRRELKRWRQALDRMLRCAEPIQFNKLIWSLSAFGRGETQLGRQFGPSFNEEEIRKANDQYAFNHWTLETLVNEHLVARQDFAPNRLGHTVLFNTNSPTAALQLIGTLRRLENAEDGIWLQSRNVMDFMGHLAQRQFPWQRGLGSYLSLYRSQYMFDFPHAQERFLQRTGVPMSEFVKCGFGLYALAINSPWISSNADMSAIEIKKDVFEKTVALISLPFRHMERTARELRRQGKLTAYKPSALRRYPCIGFPSTGHLIAPLPDLILERITAGLFYDLVGDPGVLQETVGKRFESYCALQVGACLPSISIEPEVLYSAGRGNNFATPDLRLSVDNEIFAVVECKAARAPYGARFADDPAEIAGIDEMAKGIFQIWRFVSHQRRKIGPTNTIRDDVCGVVLTLDTWLDMHVAGQREALRRAHQLRQSKDPDILEIDCRPVGFVHIQDFESVLATATTKSFIGALSAWLRNPEFDGWSLTTVHARQADRRDETALEDFEKLPPLPGLAWWHQLKDEGERRQQR